MRRFSCIFLTLAAWPCFALAQVQTSAPKIPPPEPVSMSTYLLQGIFGLIIVLGLMGLAWWLMRRIGVNKSLSNINMRVIGGISVGSRERVIVVEVGEHWLILGVTPNQINTLATMPKQDLPEGENPNGQNPFAVWFKRAMDKRKEDQHA